MLNISQFCHHTSMPAILGENDMSEIRHGTSVQGPYLQHSSIMTGFRAIRCMEVQSIQSTLEMKNCCSELSHAGSSLHDEVVYLHMAPEITKVNVSLRDLFQSQIVSFLRDSQLESTLF